METLKIRIISVNDQQKDRRQYAEWLKCVTGAHLQDCLATVDRTLKGEIQVIEVPMKSKETQLEEAIQKLQSYGFIVNTI